MKILWCDGETSGLDPKKNDLLSFSCMVEIDGKIEKGITLYMQPHNWDNIDDKALEINGFTREQIKTFDTPEVAHEKLVAFLGRYVNRFDKNDKFSLAGYNIIKFDIPFLEEFFKKCGDKYFGAWVDGEPLDVCPFVLILKKLGVLNIKGYKLQAVADALNIEFKAHDAKEDIVTTRNIYYKLLDKIEIKK